MVKCQDSRVIWNEYVELNIRAPDVQEDIPDVILYLSGDSSDALARICFKRIKAQSLLDQNGKAFDIQNYILEEDKSIDALDDEQFPGIIQACIKLYSKDPLDDFSPDRFLSHDQYTEYLL